MSKQSLYQATIGNCIMRKRKHRLMDERLVLMTEQDVNFNCVVFG